MQLICPKYVSDYKLLRAFENEHNINKSVRYGDDDNDNYNIDNRVIFMGELCYKIPLFY